MTIKYLGSKGKRKKKWACYLIICITIYSIKTNLTNKKLVFPRSLKKQWHDVACSINTKYLIKTEQGLGLVSICESCEQ